MGATTFLANAILNGIFTDPALALPATLYVGLSTTTPLDDGTNVTEPVGNNYSRVATAAADWAAAATRAKANGAIIAFPTASGSWGTCTDFVIYDANVAGNLVYFGTLTAPQTPVNGTTLRFPIGDLEIAIDPS